MSFWNSRPTHQTDGQAILFRENFEGEIQNIKNDVVGRIYSFTFNLCKQSIQIINIYGPNKPYQSLTNYITNAKNMIIGGGFNMVEDFKDRTGSSICNTNLVGSEPHYKNLIILVIIKSYVKVNLKKRNINNNTYTTLAEKPTHINRNLLIIESNLTYILG